MLENVRVDLLVGVYKTNSVILIRRISEMQVCFMTSSTGVKLKEHSA